MQGNIPCVGTTTPPVAGTRRAAGKINPGEVL